MRRQRLEISLYPPFHTRVQRNNPPPHCSAGRASECSLRSGRASVFGEPVGAGVGALRVSAAGTGDNRSVASGNGKIQPKLYHYHALKMPAYRIKSG